MTDDSRDRATRAASASIGHTIVLAMVGNNIDRRIIYGRWSISDSSGSRFSRIDLDRSHRSTIISTWKIIGGKWIQKIRKPSGSKRYENLLYTKDTKTFSIQKIRKLSGSKNSTLSNVHLQCSPIKPSTRLLRLLGTMAW